MDEKQLTAIRDRDALTIPRLLTSRMSYAEHMQLQAEMDRRDLLKEIDRLQKWKLEAMYVMAGLQELGNALGLKIGASITGTYALEAVNKLKAENVRLRERYGEGELPFGLTLSEDGSLLNWLGVNYVRQEAVNKLKAENAELLESLEGMVAQHCAGDDGELDSFALSASADAIDLLARLGRLNITHDAGRRVIATWKEEESDDG